MRGALAEFRRLWSNDSILRVAVVVAIVVSGIHVLETALYAVLDLTAFFGDYPISWRFYIEPLVRSLIVFVVVVTVSAVLLRVVHRRQQPDA